MDPAELARNGLPATFFDELVGACREVYGNRLVTVAVYGSEGRGTARPDSDVDLLVVAEGLSERRLARVDEFQAVEARLGLGSLEGAAGDRALSPIFKTPEEARAGSLLFLDMIEDARILFDRGGFFRQELDRLRQRLDRLGSRRIWLGSAWYWDLKPDFKPGDVIEL